MTADPRVHAVLAALARGILGPRYSPEIPERMLETLSLAPSEKDRAQLLATLRLLSGRAGAFALTGTAVPASWLSAREAEEVVQGWKWSRVPTKRQLASVLITLATSARYGHPCEEWERMGYPGPLGSPPKKRSARLKTTRPESDERLTCDAVIVGSGAGGGCVAAVLARAGLDVVIVEKGGYFAEGDFHHLEWPSMREMYLYGGTLTTEDLSCRIVAGSAVGGGTLVNFTTAFKTPDHVLREWAQVSGIDAFVSGELHESLEEVAERVHITTDESEPGRRDSLIEDGLAKLGWHVDALPRAVKGCKQDASCGYCGFGCRAGAKQGTMKTYLEDAVRAGARVLTNTDVRRVTIDDGRATGIEATSGRHEITISARAVVVAAGSIETPALLLRSGLGGQIGHNLHLHPGTAPWGLFDEDIRIWEGTTQSRFSREFAHWDGNYGPLFETIPIHPGSGAAAFTWLSASQHAGLMDDFGRIGYCGVLSRDTSAGRVSIDRNGAPRIRYRLNEQDSQRIAEAVIAGARVLEAAGATEVRSPHPRPLVYRPGPGAHDRWARDVRQRGIGREVTLASWHQMGSCRMGTDPSRSAVGPDNETHEVRDLFVADASTFPTASGVNPMVSIYGIANRAAKKIADRLA